MQREERGVELGEWKATENARVARNNERREEHRAAVKAWEAERDEAKQEKRIPQWNKPKLDGIEKPIPRPKATLAENDEGGGDDDDDLHSEMDQD